jgi:hypothetical protein
MRASSQYRWRLRAQHRPRGFLAAWTRLVGRGGEPAMPRRRGRRPRMPLTALLPALIFHVMQDVGSLSEHFAELFGTALADSSWSDRRTRIPWTVFTDLMARVLRPRATPRRHPHAFWRGWRLVAMDGTAFNLINSPQMRAPRPKARTRRGRAAFAKLPVNVLLEVGLHNPIAAAIGRAGESEWALAGPLLAQVPARALLLADRLYGCAAFLAPALAACQAVGSHLLVRARANLQVMERVRLADGSRRVGVPVRDPDDWRRITTWIEVREIRVQVARPGHRAHTLRLWTTLLDPEAAPALEVAELYARRWEQERYFRAVKRQLRKTDLLQSHTLDTAAQEVAAIVVASAVLAQQRAAATTPEAPVGRLSFAKVLRIVQALWFTVDLGPGILTDRQIQQLLRRGQARIRAQLTAPRRSRSCPRQVRQPMQAWPRTMTPTSAEGPVQFTVVQDQ